MAHDIPTGSGNSIPERMTRQEQAFSQLMERLGDLAAGYTLIADLREIKAISAVLREHMQTVDTTLDSLRQDLAAKLNGIDVLAMVDTGATHSFVTGREVRRLKLELKEHGYRIKAVNSEAQPVLGVASMELTLGPWSGKCSLMAVPFLQKTNLSGGICLDDNSSPQLEELNRTTQDLCFRAHNLRISWVADELSRILSANLEKDDALSAAAHLRASGFFSLIVAMISFARNPAFINN
ncbi:hypothetical protein ACH5RR_003274 [Cinchona calisaya]|uniref:Uncharacterized protein n=1 Tax=Cinchona calisaya TaxID=153742 RepID=A0ABD3AUQ7_9GENT